MRLLKNIDGSLINWWGLIKLPDVRRPFIIEIDTTLGNGFNSFQIPTRSGYVYNMDVKVSDGQEFNISAWDQSETLIQFASASVYTIEFRGEGGWSFNNTGDCLKLRSVDLWGDFLFNYLEGGFYGCTNIGLNGGLPTTGSINAPTITSINSMFKSCNLTSLYNSDMLARCENVTSAVSTFSANKIVEIPARFMHPLTKLVNALAMYSNNLINILDVDLLDNCTVLENVIGMFQTNKLQYVDDIFRNISTITDMTATFQGNLIESVVDGLLSNLVNLTILLATFEFNKFTIIKSGMFINNKNVIDYSRVFATQTTTSCLIEDNVFDLASINKVTSFYRVFYNAMSSGTVQPIWDYANITADVREAFLNQFNLTNYADIPLEWKQLSL